MNSFYAKFLSLLMLFVVSLKGYTTFDQYANSLSLTSGGEITGGSTRKSGLVGYVAMIDSTGATVVKKYNLSTGNPVLMGQYGSSSNTSIRI